MKRNAIQLIRRQKRVRFALRQKASGRLRLSVYKSDKHIYAQIIDDTKSITLAAASSAEKDFAENGATVAGAAKVGEVLAQRAIKAGVKEVVFDRGGYVYHGRVQALADAARAGGLLF